MYAYMKFVFFPVLENRENGLGDEGADEAMPPPPRIFALEPPLGLEGFVDGSPQRDPGAEAGGV